MESTDSISVPKKNRLAVIGFCLMLAGPAILIGADVYTSLIGHISNTNAGAVAWTAAILPGIGFVIGIVSLCLWNETGKLGRALAIVTLIMCNPMFYLVYLIICAAASTSFVHRVGGM